MFVPVKQHEINWSCAARRIGGAKVQEALLLNTKITEYLLLEEFGESF